MDFHFTIPNDTSHEGSENSTKRLGSMLKRLAPLFVLSAMLPLFIFFISSPADVKFLTKANNDSELRVWIEPAHVVTRPNTSIELRVYANFESDTKLLPGITFSAFSDTLDVEGDISYLRPFNGKVELGTISAISPSEGVFTITIPEDSIETTAFDAPLVIKTSPSTVYVK